MVKLCVDGGACADLTRNQFDAATASSRAPWYLPSPPTPPPTPALLELSEQLERLGMAHARDPKAATRRNHARADLHRRQVAESARRHAKAKPVPRFKPHRAK